ncbi:MAG: hypothetical protein ACT4QF_11590 [Sporichthyaceae bacterium]
MYAIPATLLTSPMPSTFLWAGCGVNKANHLDGSWVVTIEEDCGLDPDAARTLAAELLAAADLCEALRQGQA